jgi:hypothetical protein
MKITPAEFLQTELDNGVSADNPNFVQLGMATVNAIGVDYHTVLDFGSGTGVYAEQFRKSGKDVYAFEIWEEHRRYIKQHFPLVKLVDEVFTTDMLLMIEVAEHMMDDEIKTYMSKMEPKFILFSSTSFRTDFDEMWGHVNVKEQEDWISFWDGLGYFVKFQLGTPTSWTKLLQKKSDESTIQF